MTQFFLKDFHLHKYMFLIKEQSLCRFLSLYCMHMLVSIEGCVIWGIEPSQGGGFLSSLPFFGLIASTFVGRLSYRFSLGVSSSLRMNRWWIYLP